MPLQSAGTTTAQSQTLRGVSGGLQSGFERAANQLAKYPLTAILCLAAALRVFHIFAFPSFHHPDEVFQYLEQGHRFAFGYGIVPWEYQDGVRSPVIPLVLALIFKLSAPIVGGPQGYIAVAQLALAALSLISVVSVYQMGLRTSRTHAILGGIVTATWFELLYFSFRPFTEALAANFLIVALCTASRPWRDLSRRDLLVIGGCAGLCAMLRIHLLAGLLVLAIWVGRLAVKDRWLPMLLGALPVLAIFGLVDWISWGAPFFSLFQSFWINVWQGKASHYGVGPAYWYLQQMVFLWGGAIPIMVLFVLVRASRSALWLCTALAILISHSFIPHKEYRFIFPAMACLVVVAAMGSADIVERVRGRLERWTPNSITAAAIAFWIGTSAALGAVWDFRVDVHRSAAVMQTEFRLSAEPELCGLLLLDSFWTETGGYTYLHRNVPIYALWAHLETAKKSTDAFNVVLLSRSSIDAFQPEFNTVQCIGSGAPDDVCTVERPGTCRRLPGLAPLSEQLRLGE